MGRKTQSGNELSREEIKAKAKWFKVLCPVAIITMIISIFGMTTNLHTYTGTFFFFLIWLSGTILALSFSFFDSKQYARLQYN
jgi:hypothetical protein